MACMVSADRDLLSKPLSTCILRFPLSLSAPFFFVTMPRQVFSDDLEEKLIALWAEYQTKKSGIMMKRTKKEKEIADKLNLYAKEIGEDMEFSHSIVHNKIDNLKSKAKEHYKKFSGKQQLNYDDHKRYWIHQL